MPSFILECIEDQPDRWRTATGVEAALLYRQQGWAPVPACWPDEKGGCACTPEDPHEEKAIGKAPLIYGHIPGNWMPAEHVIIDAFAKVPEANVDIALEPSGLICVDLDSAEAVEEARTLGLPEAPTTRRGEGLHIFYRRPAGVAATRRIHMGGSGKIDILAQGVVVMPPSLHKSQDRYEWVVTPDEAPLGDPPAWVLSWLAKSTITVSMPEGVRRDLPHWAFLVLRDEDSAIAEYGSRSEAAFAVITAAVRAGWSDEEIVDLLGEHEWTARGKRNAEKYYREEIGRARAKAPSTEVKESGDWVFVRSRDLDPTPPDWVVEGLVPSGGVTILGGRPKLGKSTLSRQLAASIGTGRPFLGHAIRNPGPVLYVVGFGEGTEAEFLGSMGKHDALDEVWANFRAAEPETLESAVYEFRPRAVVLDTVSKVLLGRDFDSYKDMGPALKPIIDLAQRWKIAAILIHHERKAAPGVESEDPTSELLGSTQIAGSAEVVLAMRRKKDRRVLLGVGRGVGELEPMLLGYDKEGDSFTLLGKAAEVEAEEIKEDLLSFAESFAEEGFAVKDAEDQLSYSRSSIQRHLRELVEEGELEKKGLGRATRYRLP